MKTRSHPFYSLIFFALSAATLISGCAGRSAPAPVANVSSTIELFDSKAPLKPDEEYTVIRGDTLFSVAWFYGIDHQDLAKINNISEPYNIHPGQKIRLKALPTTSTLTPSSNHTKKTGLTTKSKVNQPVDPQKKQAYGNSTGTKNDDYPSGKPSTTAAQINWSWPAEGELIGRFSNAEQGNKGIDIANKAGTSIFASADGKVVYTGSALRGYGNLVIIKHSESYLTAYAHNSKILVKEQQWIKAGQEIAHMGKSDSDRVKLHFEVRYKGKSVDPLQFLPKQ